MKGSQKNRPQKGHKRIDRYRNILRILVGFSKNYKKLNRKTPPKTMGWMRINHILTIYQPCFFKGSLRFSPLPPRIREWARNITRKGSKIVVRVSLFCRIPAPKKCWVLFQLVVVVVVIFLVRGLKVSPQKLHSSNGSFEKTSLSFMIAITLSGTPMEDRPLGVLRHSQKRYYIYYIRLELDLFPQKNSKQIKHHCHSPIPFCR